MLFFFFIYMLYKLNICLWSVALHLQDNPDSTCHPSGPDIVSVKTLEILISRRLHIIKPTVLGIKLTGTQVDASLVIWIVDYLTSRPQSVCQTAWPDTIGQIFTGPLFKLDSSRRTFSKRQCRNHSHLWPSNFTTSPYDIWTFLNRHIVFPHYFLFFCFVFYILTEPL